MVQTLFAHFPMIQGFVQDIQEPGEPIPTPNIPSNSSPTVSIISPADGSTSPDNGSITFTGSGLDVEDGPLYGLFLVWTSNIDGLIGTGSPLIASLNVGNHTITLTAKDGLGATGSASVDITVEAEVPFNSSPVAYITPFADNLSFLTSDLITFTGSGFDAQDLNLPDDRLVWTSSIDGNLGTGPSIIVPLGAGSHIITLTATDFQGDIGTTTLSITVNEAPTNSAPTASINIPDDVFDYLTTDAITFAGTGSDLEDISLYGSSLVWTSDLDGTIGYDVSISVYLSAGIHLITLTAIDGEGATGSESISVTVTPPADVEVTFQKGDGQGDVSETDDAYMESDDEDDNFGDRRSLNVDERPDNHAVLKFPNIFGNGAGQIPLGSTINSATLTLRVSDTTNEDPTVYRIIESWTESEVTWDERSDDVDWSDGGADGTGSHAATAVGDFPMSKKGFQSLDVTASLQLWSNGELNEGWVFIDNSDNGADFDSSETGKKGDRPKLTVNYTPP